jgi:hypothetical protein
VYNEAEDMAVGDTPATDKKAKKEKKAKKVYIIHSINLRSFCYNVQYACIEASQQRCQFAMIAACAMLLMT